MENGYPLAALFLSRNLWASKVRPTHVSELGFHLMA